MIRNLPRRRYCVQMTVRIVAAIAGAAGGILVPAEGNAQPGCAAHVRELPSGAQSARVRVARITRIGAAHSDLVADAASCGPPVATMESREWAVRTLRGRHDTVRLTLHWPEARVSMLGGLADPRDSDGIWSGRGMTTYGTSAVSVDAGPLHGLFAPYVLWTENRRFEVFRSGDSLRSSFASPWYFGDYSIDLPSRMGASQFTELNPGNSALWLTAGPVEAGFSSSRQAWGPGLRTHLLLGPDAPGIPRWFVRTSEPFRTRVGAVSFTAFTGRLSESRFFDADPANDRRALVSWSTAFTPGADGMMTLGVSHATLTLRGDSARKRERMVALSLEVRSPGDAFRGWGELARIGGFPAWRRFLTTPYEGVAYVAGLEYAQRRASGTLLLSAELGNLEQPRDVLEEPPRDFYTSDVIPHGWTHRGRLLGAPTGPGSQSQWLAVDWVESRWSAGVFGERVRWNEDAFLRQFLPYTNRHDVTLRAGLRGGLVVRWYEASIQLSLGKRINYLFQNGSYFPGLRTIDVAVPQLRLAITPILRR